MNQDPSQQENGDPSWQKNHDSSRRESRDPFIRIDLGTCCACEKTGESVRNLVMLPELAPVAGTGWGCAVCGLAADGAMAVMCDACLASHAEIRFAMSGYATDRLRIERKLLEGVHEHNQEHHRTEERQRARQMMQEQLVRDRRNGNGNKPGKAWRRNSKQRTQKHH